MPAIPPTHPNRMMFHSLIQTMTAWIGGFWILGTTATAAGSISGEREDDTWITLLSTTVEGKEILRAKMLGAILRFRWLGLTLLIVWVCGVIAGSIHPMGLASAILELAIFLWFASALGMRSSLNSGSTSKSLTVAVGILMFVNVGYQVVLALIFQGRAPTIFHVGLMPFDLYHSLLSDIDFRRFDLFQAGTTANDPKIWLDQPIPTVVLGGILYAILAAILTMGTFARFARIAECPSFDRDDEEPPVPAKAAVEEIAVRPLPAMSPLNAD